MLNSSAKNRASTRIKSPPSCPEYSAALWLCADGVAVSALREASADAAHVRCVSHDSGESPRRAPHHICQDFSPLKVQWRGWALLVSAFGVPGGAWRLLWQEEELPEQQEIPLSRVFPNRHRSWRQGS